MEPRICKAVIPAAGKGTRLLPASRTVPKEMFPVVDRPVLHYVVEEALRSGIRELCLVTSRGKSSIEDYVDGGFQEFSGDSDESPRQSFAGSGTGEATICTVRQTRQLGLGHAVLQAERFAGNSPFAVLLADDIMVGQIPVMKQLLTQYERHPGAIIGARRVPKERVSEYGILDVEAVPDSLDPNLFRVRKLVEKPSKERAPSDLGIMGRYILTPGIFDGLRRTDPGALGEIQLTDGIQDLIRAGEAVYAYCFEGDRFEVGDVLGFLEANVEMALRRRGIGPQFRRKLEEILSGH